MQYGDEDNYVHFVPSPCLSVSSRRRGKKCSSVSSFNGSLFDGNKQKS